ncbi:hypothetical protein DSM106972_056960 [Dulcicalothrix desertica PCC 7102]|uniref:Uncharacterized protein n=1 Tax=Dulcicalothrix desertica PCC 7102 TaxID=232991 RepID=A0A433V9I0_9CYAN|nr:hypothetical protein [Dulcicalothrix desertica]RUT02776.1 hypothetical protein DSM106972_056960 [Dulcicalothrix desertica PCC 7102]TWH38990.1 hypothetical protein CAL7102_08193 [Dulcicalothrix desertica PCC 7102]
MHRQTRYLLALGIAASTTMAVNPCHAQTVTDNVDNSSDKELLAPQPASNQNITNPTDKSLTPSNAVSQTSVEKAAIPNVNPRIPISSRIFPAMQQ